METTLKYLIPVAVGATFIVLCIGLFSLFKGGSFNRSYSNKLMRLRVLLQFIAICLIAAASLIFHK